MKRVLGVGRYIYFRIYNDAPPPPRPVASAVSRLSNAPAHKAAGGSELEGKICFKATSSLGSGSRILYERANIKRKFVKKKKAGR